MTTNEPDFYKIDIPLNVSLARLYSTIHKLIFKFPKHERYALGEKMENTILTSIELLLITNQSTKYEKEKLLIKVNAKIELLKILIRMCLDCGIINTKDYLTMQGNLQEIGKMTQGWIKYARNLK